LTLDGSQGAFIVNTGVLEIIGARLDATPDAKSDFRPFLLTTFAGATQVSRSVIADLGSPAFPESSGLAFTHQFSASGTASMLRDNVFRNGVGVAVTASNRLDVTGNRFVDGSKTAVLVRAARDVRIADNIVSQRTGTHGIKVTDSSSQIDISHNVIIDSPGNGIFVDGGATDVRISRNLVGKSRLAGVSVAGSACVAITSNFVIANGSRGIAMRSVLRGKVEDNHLIANGSAGLAISGQSDHAALLVSRNIFKDNRFGLSGARLGELSLSANDFEWQLPRIADGEFATNLGELLEFVASSKPGEFKLASTTSEGGELSQFSAVDLARCVAKKRA
jgi:poly(beta-D-mannuronate) C5 epimerase